MTAGTLPNIQWSSPITVTADAPILYVLQPLAKTALADGIWNPVNGIVVGNQLLLYSSHLDEPGLTSVVNQWSITTPAVRIAMLKLWCLEELASSLQIIQNQWICILNKGAWPISILSHITLGINKLYERHIVCTANSSIVLTKGWGSMNNTSTITGGYIAIAHYIESLLLDFALCIWIKRLILTIFQSLALEALQNRMLPFFIGKNRLHQGLGHNKVLTFIGYLYIINLWIYYQAQVGRQSPRGSGPSQEVGIILILSLEFYHSGTFLNILIALSYLMGGQRSTTARAIRYNLVALVQQALLPDFVQCPPYRLNIIIFIGNIWMLHIRPEAYYIGEFLPHALVLPNRLTAFLDKWLNAVPLNLLFAIQAQQFLNLQLNRQTVGIPTSLAENLLPLHGLITRQHILDNTSQHMANMRLAIGSRRAIVKGKGITALTVTDTLVSNIIFLPKLQNFGFSIHEVQIRIDFVVHSLSSSQNKKAPVPK